MGVVLLYLLHKLISRPVITPDTIRDSIKEAVRDIEYENELIVEKKEKSPESIYNRLTADTPVRKSGGNLVPYNLTEKEKEILEMFYGD